MLRLVITNSSGEPGFGADHHLPKSLEAGPPGRAQGANQGPAATARVAGFLPPVTKRINQKASRRRAVRHRPRDPEKLSRDVRVVAEHAGPRTGTPHGPRHAASVPAHRPATGLKTSGWKKVEDGL